MHRTRLYVLPALLMTILLILPACSSDDDPATPNTNVGDPPEFDISNLENYETPASMVSSGDIAVREIVENLDKFGWLGLQVARLVPPATKAGEIAKAGPWIYSWTVGEDPDYDMITYQLMIHELADRYTWQLRMTGTQSGTVWTNYLYIEAEVAKNASWGWLEEYDYFGSAELQRRWSWEILGATLNITLDVNDFIAPYRLVSAMELDGSGNLSYFKGIPPEGWLWKYSSWNSAGVGEWTEYDAEGTEVGGGGFGN